MERHDLQRTSRATLIPLRLASPMLTDGQLWLQWSGNGVLQYADQVVGPWQNLVTTNNQYRFTPEGLSGFFRLRSP
jgi:hypothetical protein